jgi:putative sterol carrier protein
VLFVVQGVLGRHILVAVSGGRAAPAPLPPEHPPTVTLTMEQDEFWRRCHGRLDPVEAASPGPVGIAGDDALGREVLAALAFMV